MKLFPQIADQWVTDLAALPPQELAQLQEQIESFAQQLKACKERLADAIALKYDVRVTAVRQSLAKETGIVRFDDDGIEVVADIAKKPHWDQEKLSNIAERIRVNGEDPLEFLSVTYKVPESKYNAWPEHLRQIFAPARTLNLGKQSFSLMSAKEGKV